MYRTGTPSTLSSSKTPDRPTTSSPALSTLSRSSSRLSLAEPSTPLPQPTPLEIAVTPDPLLMPGISTLQINLTIVNEDTQKSLAPYEITKIEAALKNPSFLWHLFKDDLTAFCYSQRQLTGKSLGSTAIVDMSVSFALNAVGMLRMTWLNSQVPINKIISRGFKIPSPSSRSNHTTIVSDCHAYIDEVQLSRFHDATKLFIIRELLRIDTNTSVIVQYDNKTPLLPIITEEKPMSALIEKIRTQLKAIEADIKSGIELSDIEKYLTDEIKALSTQILGAFFTFSEIINSLEKNMIACIEKISFDDHGSNGKKSTTEEANAIQEKSKINKIFALKIAFVSQLKVMVEASLIHHALHQYNEALLSKSQSTLQESIYLRFINDKLHVIVRYTEMASATAPRIGFEVGDKRGDIEGSAKSFSLIQRMVAILRDSAIRTQLTRQALHELQRAPTPTQPSPPTSSSSTPSPPLEPSLTTIQSTFPLPAFQDPLIKISKQVEQSISECKFDIANMAKNIKQLRQAALHEDNLGKPMADEISEMIPFIRSIQEKLQTAKHLECELTQLTMISTIRDYSQFDIKLAEIIDELLQILLIQRMTVNEKALLTEFFIKKPQLISRKLPFDDTHPTAGSSQPASAHPDVVDIEPLDDWDDGATARMSPLDELEHSRFIHASTTDNLPPLSMSILKALAAIGFDDVSPDTKLSKKLDHIQRRLEKFLYKEITLSEMPVQNYMIWSHRLMLIIANFTYLCDNIYPIIDQHVSLAHTRTSNTFATLISSYLEKAKQICERWNLMLSRYITEAEPFIEIDVADNMVTLYKTLTELSKTEPQDDIITDGEASTLSTVTCTSSSQDTQETIKTLLNIDATYLRQQLQRLQVNIQTYHRALSQREEIHASFQVYQQDLRLFPRDFTPYLFEQSIYQHINTTLAELLGLQNRHSISFTPSGSSSAPDAIISIDTLVSTLALFLGEHLPITITSHSDTHKTIELHAPSMVHHANHLALLIEPHANNKTLMISKAHAFIARLRIMIQELQRGQALCTHLRRIIDGYPRAANALASLELFDGETFFAAHPELRALIGQLAPVLLASQRPPQVSTSQAFYDKLDALQKAYQSALTQAQQWYAMINTPSYQLSESSTRLSFIALLETYALGFVPLRDYQRLQQWLVHIEQHPAIAQHIESPSTVCSAPGSQTSGFWSTHTASVTSPPGAERQHLRFILLSRQLAAATETLTATLSHAEHETSAYWRYIQTLNAQDSGKSESCWQTLSSIFAAYSKNSEAPLPDDFIFNLSSIARTYRTLVDYETEHRDFASSHPYASYLHIKLLHLTAQAYHHEQVPLALLVLSGILGCFEEIPPLLNSTKMPSPFFQESGACTSSSTDTSDRLRTTSMLFTQATPGPRMIRTQSSLDVVGLHSRSLRATSRPGDLPLQVRPEIRYELTLIHFIEAIKTALLQALQARPSMRNTSRF